jgi:acetyl-CoA carboxylase carboxyl transferase subunit beta
MLDEDSFIEHDADLSSKDILGFSGGNSTYRDKLDAEIKKTGMLSAIISGEGKLDGRRVGFAVTDSAFIAGSMGSVVGEKFTRLVEFCARERIPFISVSGSGGGARMQEGMYSLMQMAKTSAALARLRGAGIPYLSVVTHSTMGGVWASWAALGDIIIAEPGAQIGFTGPRVIKTTINRDLPEGFQRSEYMLVHGQLDQIVKRADLRPRLISLLNLLLGAAAA